MGSLWKDIGYIPSVQNAVCQFVRHTFGRKNCPIFMIDW
jgi:hypothetical protein